MPLRVKSAPENVAVVITDVVQCDTGHIACMNLSITPLSLRYEFLFGPSRWPMSAVSPGAGSPIEECRRELILYRVSPVPYPWKIFNDLSSHDTIRCQLSFNVFGTAILSCRARVARESISNGAGPSRAALSPHILAIPFSGTQTVKRVAC